MPGYSKEWRRIARQAKDEAERNWQLGIITYCSYCGGGIDMTLPRNDGADFTMDHIVAKINGGMDLRQNARPMHRSCNTKRRHERGGGEGYIPMQFNNSKEW